MAPSNKAYAEPMMNHLMFFKNELPTVEHRTVVAVYSEYAGAALLFDTGETIRFACTESSAGHWFEVFPISVIDSAAEFPIPWKKSKYLLKLYRARDCFATSGKRRRDSMVS